MPKVGNKSFPYTERGEGQAEIYAAQTGQAVSSEEKDSFGYGTYQQGGEVKTSDEEFEVAIEREIFPPEDQGHDRHLDNLKAIREWALANPDRFYARMNEDDASQLKNHLTKEFAKYGGDDVNNLMWGSDEWEMAPEGMQDGGPVKRFGY